MSISYTLLSNDADLRNPSRKRQPVFPRKSPEHTRGGRDIAIDREDNDSGSNDRLDLVSSSL